MKTSIFKIWQLALLACGLALVGVGLQVTGETVSPTGEPGSSAVPRGVGLAVQTNTVAVGETAPNELLRSSTNNPVPPNLNITPDLSEIIKLAQAGLSEEVLLAYITNSVRVFNLGADEIIYLNDLGVPSPVVAAMIQQDTLPESATQKLSGNQASQLPAGLALNTPATNIYPVQQNPDSQLEEPEAEVAPEAAATASYAASDYAPQPTSISYFYNALSPYGNWVNVSGYGWCWQPTVVVTNPSWRPYCDRGRWIYSDCGWYWLSDYSWGWAPFHYGRWVSDANYGWVWSPDCTWGPAWVSWRYSNDYCGWAPLPPEACYTAGVGFTYNNRSVGFGFEFGLGANCYNFVPTDRFCDYSPSRYCVSPAYVKNVCGQTKVVNKIKVKGNGNTITINEGIDPAHIAAASRNEIRKVAIRDAQPAVGKNVRHDRLEKEGNALVVYRPQLPSPSSARPATSGGRPRPENRTKAAGIVRPSTTDLAATSHTESSSISSEVPVRLVPNNSTYIRPSLAQNSAPPTASPPEAGKSRVSVTRSSGGLTIRGERRPTQVASVAQTTSDSTRVQPNGLMAVNEPPRAVQTQRHLQPRANDPRVQTPATAQPIVQLVAETTRVERRQPITIRYAPSESQTTRARPQFSQPVVAASQPYTPPARQQFHPTATTYSQPSRVERSNNYRAQSQSTQPAAPQYSPTAQNSRPVAQPIAPARANSQPSSLNSNIGSRPR